MGNKIAVTDRRGNTTTTEHDVLDRPVKLIDAECAFTAYTYDAEGNLTQTTAAKGQVFSRTFDALNRLIEQDFPEGSDVTRISTTYDANGNADTITEAKATGVEITTHEYDLLDRLISQSQRGRAIHYTYDNNGNRTSVTSLGGTTSYTYDSRNRLSTVVAGSASSYSYFANGWLEQVIQGNGTSAAYTYDGVGRIISITNTLGNGEVLSSFAYEYDPNGNRTQQVETQNGFTTAQVLTTDYVYDSLDRLESYTETSGSGDTTTVTAHSFTYYPSYDRKTQTVEQNGTTLKNRVYQYDETYWLTDISESAASGGTIAYQYDANGNTTHKTDTTSGGAQSTLFSYNSRNQLKQVATGTPGAEINQGSHDYNYAGMRIRHLNSERGSIEYLYDGDSIIDEVQNNTGSLVAHYRYGDRLLSLNSNGADQFYHYASLGTTVNLTNAAGGLQVAYRTDPFGEITQQEGESVNRQVFTGQEHDEKTGLIYFGARFYDPDTARFINQDTYLGESTTPPSLHRYLYAYGNPLVYIDENGNFSIEGASVATLEALKAKTSISIAETAAARAASTPAVLTGAIALSSIPGPGLMIVNAAKNRPAQIYSVTMPDGTVQHSWLQAPPNSQQKMEIRFQYEYQKHSASLAESRACICTKPGTYEAEQFFRLERDIFKSNNPGVLDARSGSGAFSDYLEYDAKRPILTQENSPLDGGNRIDDGATSQGGSSVGDRRIIDPSRLLPSPTKRTPEKAGSPIVSEILPAGYKFNQAVSPGQKTPGKFGTDDVIPDVNYVREDLAVIPSFKEIISGVRQVETTRPVRVQRSTVGAQEQDGKVYKGGGTQIDVLEYDPYDPFVKFSGPETPLE